MATDSITFNVYIPPRGSSYKIKCAPFAHLAATVGGKVTAYQADKCSLLITVPACNEFRFRDLLDSHEYVESYGVIRG